MNGAVSQNVVVIEAGRTERHYWRDLWRYRELLWFLARRDVSVRYKQAVLGIGWAVARPLLAMLVFTLVFGRIAKLPSGGAPYTLLVFCGMVPWFFFATAVGESSLSLVANANLLTKVYFPRLLLAASAILVALLDLLISTVLLMLLAISFGYGPTLRWLALPGFVALGLAAGLGLGLWFAALNVKYRDFQFIVPFVLQVGLYASPIGFSTSLIPEQWRLLYSLNPLVSIVDGFRWVVIGDRFVPRIDALILAVGITLALVLGGIWFFRRTERAFADVI